MVVVMVTLMVKVMVRNSDVDKNDDVGKSIKIIIIICTSDTSFSFSLSSVETIA